MLTYELKKAPGVPLYEALYRCIREDILSGKLAAGEKLPSKRALAAHLEVSKVTVEGAYSQLLAEGYLRSEEKVGYFVESGHHIRPGLHAPAPVEDEPPEWALDLTANAPATGFLMSAEQSRPEIPRISSSILKWMLPITVPRFSRVQPFSWST